MGRGLINKVATRIAQTADSGINLIRFMTGLLHETHLLKLSGVSLRMNYGKRCTSDIDLPSQSRVLIDPLLKRFGSA